MWELIVRHLSESEPSQFEVEDSRSKIGPTATNLLPADTFPVAGDAKRSLTQEIRWYVESYLDYPFSPATHKAAQVQDALRAWGQRCFRDLFRALGESPSASEIQDLHFVVVSRSPRVLSWPWEAVEAPGIGPLGLTGCSVSRRLPDLSTRPNCPERDPAKPLEVLLVTARPDQAEQDSYRSIAKQVVDLVSEGLPMHVHLARPPTIENFARRLKERDWDVLHFDVHGLADRGHGGIGGKTESYLELENDFGSSEFLPASVLRHLFQERPVPIVVLNACRSAAFSPATENARSSIATTLLEAGAQSVVAMSHAVYRSAAEILVPNLYRELLDGSSLEEALSAGRRALDLNPQRHSARGRFELRDWLIPVLYQSASKWPSMPPVRAQGGVAKAFVGARVESETSQFIGRDRYFLQLDRAISRETPAIVLYGLSGIGKTSLARFFAEWVRDSGWLETDMVWQVFQVLETFDETLRELSFEVLGNSCSFDESARRNRALVDSLRIKRRFVVWDNFESWSSVAGKNDLELARNVLCALAGGASKILVLSLRSEDWMGEVGCRVLMGGLEDEERWLLSQRLIAGAEVNVDPTDHEFVRLLDHLDGHPLAMRLVLPELLRSSPSMVRYALEEDPESPTLAGHAGLTSALRIKLDGLPDSHRPFLPLLALHEKLLDGTLFGRIDP